MLRINKVENEENLILKEYEPITLTEVGTGRKRKLLLENKEEKKEEFISEDFFDIIICLASVTREITKTNVLNEVDIAVIEEQKQKLIEKITELADRLNLNNKLNYNEVKTEKQELKEELKPVEYVEYDVIPLLRFTEIQSNLNTIIEGYMDIGENLTYEKTSTIATDLTRIENAIDNIATTLSEELKKDLIYKK